MTQLGDRTRAHRAVRAAAAALRKQGMNWAAAPLLALALCGIAQAQLVVSDLPDSPDPAPAGGTVTYDLRLAETNGQALSGGAFTFSVPANARWAGTGALPGGATCSGMSVGQSGPGVVSCTGISIPTGGFAMVPLRVTTMTQGTVSVTVTPTPGGPPQSELTTVNAGADLGVSLTVAGSASAGSVLAIDFVVQNLGPDASPASTLTYSVPTGLSGLSVPAGCSVAASTMTCSVGALAVGAGRTLSVSGTIGAGNGSTLTHTADVAAGGGVGDGISTNNTVSGNTAVTAGTTLTVDKTKSVADPVPTGTTFNFVLAPRFSGDFPSNLQVRDVLPANFAFVGGSPAFTSNGWACSASSSFPTTGGTITCSRAGSGSAGANVALGNVVIPVRAETVGSGILNTGELSATGATTATDTEATTVIVPIADMDANKQLMRAQSSVPLNVPFDYRLSATNVGPTAFPSTGIVRLVDTVPAGLQVNAVTPGAGFTCVSSGGATFPQAGPVTITCSSSNVSVALGATTAFTTLNAQATAVNASLTNTMCVSTQGGPSDNNASNDCAGAGVNAQQGPDLAEIRTLKRVVGAGDALNNPQLAAQAVTWEIEVVNAGPATATAVAVTDVFNNAFTSGQSLSVLPGTSSVAASCALATGTNNISLQNCVIDTLPVCTPGVDCPRLRVSVRHFGNGTSGSNDFSVTNTAFALTQLQGDSNLGDNTSPAATAYYTAQADVAVTKAANPEPVPAGQVLTYTITASNPSATSGSAAFDVTVTDTLPEGLVFLAADAPTGSCPTTPGVGVTTSAGNRTLVCGWTSLNRNTQQTVTVRVRPTVALSVAGGGTGTINNQVTIATTTPEVAGGATNNTFQRASSVTAPVFDLLVNNSDNADPVDVGDNVTYTVTATNNRASTAEDVRLSIALPAGAGAPTYVGLAGSLPAGTVCDTTGVTAGAVGGTVVCTISRLGGTGSGSTGETPSVAVQLVLRGESKGQFATTATVAFTDPSLNALDVLPGNNTAVQPTSFRFKADVQVVGKVAVRPGSATPVTTVSATQTFDWLVSLRNNGPQEAETNAFEDVLPAGLELAGAPVFTVTSGTFTPGAPTCTGTVGGSRVDCTITSMPSGGTATVRIPVRFSAVPVNGTAVTNTASLITTGSGDTNGGPTRTAGNNFSAGSVTVQTASVGGRVFHDANANGAFDAGEAGIATTVTLTGTDDFGQAVSLTATSNATTGLFAFDVAPGTYTLTEAQPAAYLPGLTRSGAVSGAGSTAGTVPAAGAGVTAGPNGSNANQVVGIVLGAGGQSPANLFGEVRAASVAGRVYLDTDGSGTAAAGEPGIAGVTFDLTGTDFLGNAVTTSTVSASGTGDFGFTGLRPGTYTVAERAQPAGYADGAEGAGTAGGSTAVDDRVSGIVLASGVAATGYGFGERRTRVPVQVFEDGGNDGVPQAGDAGIPGVVLHLTGTDAGGLPIDLVATPVAGQPGHYEFLNVPPSGPAGYTITETQPATYAPGRANPNGNPGTAQPGGNVMTGVIIPSANVPLSTGTYYFGELTSGQVRGRTYYDRNGDGQPGAGELGLAGTAVALVGTDANGNAVSRTTATDANGDYVFDNVAPGTYSLVETRPAGYTPGLTRPGTVSGAASVRGTVPTSGSGVTAGPNGSDANRIDGLVLGTPGSSSSNNLFASVRPASIEGVVFADALPANGVRDVGEPGVAGVAVAVRGTDLFGNAVALALTTDATGRYAAANLLPGTYRVDETQPAGVIDGPEIVGTVGGVARGTANPAGVNDRIDQIALVSEDAGTGYDFGERGGQLAGAVYADRDNDGVQDAGEPGIAGVSVALTGRTAGGVAVSLTVVTDADGRYRFDGLLPSDATGYTLRETQPITYADGRDTAGGFNGTATGTAANDTISGIVYAGGNGDGYTFGERGGAIAGTVYNDANTNGVREMGDLPLAGVLVTLTGNDADGVPVTRTAVTAADGTYLLPNLPLPDAAGYALTQTQPTGYDNGGERPGSLGGSVPGPNRMVVTMSAAGAEGVGYDFSERSQSPSSIAGTVWRDSDHDRSRQSGEPIVAGWAVELLTCRAGAATCAASDQLVLNSVVTAADGAYRFDNVVPGAYTVRFRSPSGQLVGGVWPTDPAKNAVGGPNPTPAADAPRTAIAVQVAAGERVVRQDLPLDPGGIVYDSLNGQPVAGAVVTFTGPAGFDPAAHLLGGVASVTTGADGSYQFDLLPGAPAGAYGLSVQPPAAYVASLTFPPATGPLDAQSCAAPSGTVDPVGAAPCVVSAALPAAGTAPPYFLSLVVPVGGGQRVVGNHLPLDPQGTGTVIELRKTSPKLNVKKGELVPYAITARNTRAVALGNVVLVDTLPPGFKYVTGSLTVQRLPSGAIEPVTPRIDGRRLTVPARAFAASESVRLTMVLGVGTGVGEGDHVNQVAATQGEGGSTLSNVATATVRVVPDALLDCTDVIGKVFDDRNANGYQDDGERGLANVRVATVNGLLVTTDADGRYHIACAAVPKEGTGSNIVLKLDERTLPSGYRVTSENPASERATRGKLVKVNFGATVHRVVRLELRAEAFDGEGLQPAQQAELARVVSALDDRPSVLRLAYRGGAGEPAALAEARLAALTRDLQARWRQRGQAQGRPLYNLDIEVERVPSSVDR